MQNKFIITMFIILGVLRASGQSEGLLPIYTNPMVFLNQNGEVACTLPPDHIVMNNEDGTLDRGWAMGMAGNSAFVGGFSGVKNEKERGKFIFMIRREK